MELKLTVIGEVDVGDEDAKTKIGLVSTIGGTASIGSPRNLSGCLPS